MLACGDERLDCEKSTATGPSVRVVVSEELVRGVNDVATGLNLLATPETFLSMDTGLGSKDRLVSATSDVDFVPPLFLGDPDESRCMFRWCRDTSKTRTMMADFSTESLRKW